MNDPIIENYRNQAMLFFAERDFSKAFAALEHALNLNPNYSGLHAGIGACLSRLGRYHEALDHLKLAKNENPNDLNTLAALTIVYGKLGQTMQARFHGERVLAAKDEAVCNNLRVKLPTNLSLNQNTLRALDHGKNNVISFSLFGSNEKYLNGAIENVMIAPQHYPGWRCRFYCDDTVPNSALTRLKKEKAEVVMMERAENYTSGLFWRFLVVEDKSVNRFLIRDCDSLINRREQYAVSEWISSRRCFHIMRDYYSHTDLILAGMWGGVAGILPSLEVLLDGFVFSPNSEKRIADQIFLGERVWPLIKNHCLIHDGVFRVFGAQDFPPFSELPNNHHVGECIDKTNLTRRENEQINRQK